MSRSFGYRIYLGAVGGATLLALLLRTLALFFDYDAIGYFGGGALSIITAILQALTVIGCIAYAILTKEEKRPFPAVTSSADRWLSAVAACFFFAIAILLLLRAPTPGHTAFAILAGLSLLIGAVYFVLQFLGLRGALSLCAVGAILATVFFVMLTYFDLYTPMNAPRKISLHLSLLICALFLLYELRAAVATPMPRVHATVSAVCVAIALSMSGSNLIYSLACDRNGLYLLGDVLCLMIGLVAVFRLAGTLRAAPQDAKQEDDQ